MFCVIRLFSHCSWCLLSSKPGQLNLLTIGMQSVQAPSSKNMSTFASKLWWRGQVLACLAPVAANDGNARANSSVTEENANELLQQLTALGVEGIWVGEPDMAEQVMRVQSLGIRTLVAIPLVKRPDALIGCASDAVSLVKDALWFDQEPVAPTVHAALSRLYKARSHPWPCWLLAVVHVEDEAPTQVLKRHLLSAMQLSLKGTCLLPAPIALNTGCLPPQCARFMVWRHGIPALIQGSIRLLPMHDNLLMYVREADGQKVLCVFNLSGRYVRFRLPDEFRSARILAGSGLTGGRLVNQHIDCDPWGALFAAVLSCKSYL